MLKTFYLLMIEWLHTESCKTKSIILIESIFKYSVQLNIEKKTYFSLFLQT